MDQAGILRAAVEQKRNEYIDLLNMMGVKQMPDGRKVDELTYSELQEEFVNVKSESA
ncbi:Fur-regulated basic protein FbpA [Bacillus tianshenii]|nr:Fur-regulated basic protein FbpA [Bacillus tianshenii]